MLSLIALAVVLVHAVFLREARIAAPSADGRARAPVAAVRVRTVTPVAPAEMPAALPLATRGATTVDATPAPNRATPVLARPTREIEAARSLPSAPPRIALRRTGALASALPADTAPAPGPLSEDASADASSTSVPDGASLAEPIPTYPTTIPPPFTQVYELRRGALIGRAELHWRPAADRYEAQLSASLGELRWLDWVSRGGFDAAGIAPLRFTDQRRGRAAQAANFQRLGHAAGSTISYSGPAVRHPLHAGAQDRLSWIVQLSAIAQSRGVALSRGDTITLYVAGARGDADTWVFTVAGLESIDGVLGRVDALKLVREPRRPYDTRAEIWLDPACEHLPARMRLTHLPRGEALEFVLQQHTLGVRP